VDPTMPLTPACHADKWGPLVRISASWLVTILVRFVGEVLPEFDLIMGLARSRLLMMLLLHLMHSLLS
jgi:hypothetical protein